MLLSLRLHGAQRYDLGAMVVNGDLNVRSVSSLEGKLFRVESTGIRNLRGSLVVSSGPRVSKHVADDVQ